MKNTRFIKNNKIDKLHTEIRMAEKSGERLSRYHFRHLCFTELSVHLIFRDEFPIFSILLWEFSLSSDGHRHAFSDKPMADASAPYKQPMSDGLADGST